jgi:hypothetical protein
MEVVVEQAGTDLPAVMGDLISKVRGATARIFGCWHLKLSRPFSRGSDTYRTCVACGARRRFDLDQCKMVGSFYYPRA